MKPVPEAETKLWGCRY